MPVRHPDVRYFELEKAAASSAGVYLDLDARELAARRRLDERLPRPPPALPRVIKSAKCKLPVAYLVRNFTPPVGGKEARLSHDEIITLVSLKPATACTICSRRWTNWA